MSAVSAVSLPNYAQSVSSASAPGGKPPTNGKPPSDSKANADNPVDGATTLITSATSSDKVNILA